MHARSALRREFSAMTIKHLIKRSRRKLLPILDNEARYNLKDAGPIDRD